MVDLISRLLMEQQCRLGRQGAEEVKRHPWLEGIDWKEVRKLTPPFMPDLTSEIDTKYFDPYEESEPWVFEGEETLRKDFNFVGYTYKLDQ